MKNSDSQKYEFDNLKAFTPLLHFNKTDCLDKWKDKAEKKLCELLGLPLNPCEPTLETEYTTEFDRYTEYRFTVMTEPDYFVPCHLLIPKSEGPVPLTLCLSGHASGMHIALGRPKNEKDEQKLRDWPHRNMAQRSLNEGRAALIIEARNFGESSLEGYGTTCKQAGKIALLMGRTIVGERVWDAMRILDAVSENFDKIDMDNIVCTGNSGGGTATYYLACLDRRIKAAAPSCAICTYEDSIAAIPHCTCNYIPGIRKYFEMGDLAGLIAPRVLVVAAGKEDKIFPIDGTKRNFEQIQTIYDAAGAGDRCALVVGDGGHLNYADEIWQKLHELGI